MDALRQLDTAALFLLNHLGPEGPTRELVVRLTATGLMYVLLAIVLYLGLTRPGGRRILLSALAGALLAVLVGKLLNQLLPRDRPFVALPDQVRHIPLIVRPDSFPSIHAVAGFGLVGGVLFAGQLRWGLAMLGIGLVMIAARVAAGVHWPSDVLGGALLGLAGSGLFVYVLGRARPHRGQAPTSPAAAPDPPAGSSPPPSG